MRRIFAFLRTTTFLLLLCSSLAVTTAGLAVKTVMLSAQVTTMTASAASATLAKRKAIAKAVAKTKAKARLRRVVAAIPFVGIAAIGYFEHRDFAKWQEQHPEGTPQQYSCEVAAHSAEVVDEVVQEVSQFSKMPESFRQKTSDALMDLTSCEESPADSATEASKSLYKSFGLRQLITINKANFWLPW
ncbi:hypothetical protein [Polycladidibacter hongkongensis]|uniref:hypothetical protein n=1 Tax=Polycladidibacter hongkongensis TaxID=1647556 RepID=UPI00082A1307|nr:hypothetical protein [Pseudovibrio hongkongensis]